MEKKVFRCIALALCLGISACKVQISVPEQGRVSSLSGTRDCEAGKVCVVEVVDLLFDETFSMEPTTDGVSYGEWVKKDRGLCGGNAKACRLFTSGFEGNAALMAFLDDDEEVFFLEPGFFQITSPAFTFGDPIPRKFTCDGSDFSPELDWSAVPKKAKSLVLIVDDPDAPRINPWVHWIAYNVPANVDGMPESVPVADYPEGTLSGRNDFGSIGYGGPCPPSGTHRYFFSLYALDAVLPDLGRPTVFELRDAMEQHVIAETFLMGTYSYP
ncbi:MAG: YbhB/YbcL family Raf kinase inhibitor-like protein [Haliea sp.]|jgi:Raf kinase inhibitor-like YbhB/YbcL family protein|nr:YbhB/YbcL family Raf kinase inhibitor-like protein [Haliea sp.]MDP4918498.1 YbhB/YbcL family Raf kinase inhibitor-like protein [Haliea sp.]